MGYWAQKAGQTYTEREVVRQETCVHTKLTLRIDEELIERAKSHARQSGKSVSQLVSDYLEMLPGPGEPKRRPLTPLVESLRGVLAGSGLDEEAYRRHLEEKYL